MPYIDPESRPPYDVVINQLPNFESAGDLNYVLTEICARYLLHRGFRYTYLHDVMAVLEEVRGEFKRRLMDPYEDKKIKQNGDTPGFKRLVEKLEKMR